MNYSIVRVVSFATKNYIRNIGLSVMTMTILVLALLSINALIVVNSLTDASLALLERRVDISIDFFQDAEPQAIADVVKKISDMSDVSETVFFDANAVKEQFQERHKNDENILSALSALDHNPFGPSLLVRAESSANYERILEELEDEDYEELIEKKSLGEHTTVVNRINDITSKIRDTALFFAGIFGLFSVFIIFNTMRVAMYTQREEIGIMRLVGASKWFIRMPFYMECLYHVVIALLVATVITFIAIDVIDPMIKQMFDQTQFSLLVDMKQRALGMMLVEFAVVFFMTLLASTIAMRKYLKV